MLLSTNNYPQFRRHKLCPKFIGPFLVKRVRGAVISLDLPQRYRIHANVNVEQIRPFSAPNDGSWPDRTAAPPPPVVDAGGQPLFIMERFLEERTFRGKQQILVHWAGYGPESDSWEPRSAVAPQSPLLLQQFLASRPGPTPVGRRSGRRGGGGS